MIQLILIFLSILESVECNLALNKPILVNGLTYSASKQSVDGDEFSCGATLDLLNPTTTVNQWLLIDLNGRYDITTFHIITDITGALVGAFNDITIEILETNLFLKEDVNKPKPSPCLCLDQSAITASNTSCPTVCTGRFVYIYSGSNMLTGYCEIRFYGTKNTDPVIRYEFTKQLTPVHNHSQSALADDVQFCAKTCTLLPTCIAIQYLPNTTCNIVTSILVKNGDQSGVSYGLTHIITTCD